MIFTAWIIVSGNAAQAFPPVIQTVEPLNVTIDSQVKPQVTALLSGLMRDGRTYQIDGQPVFGSGDKFLAGKIANSVAWLIVTTSADDPRRQDYIRGFRELSRLTLNDGSATWGMFYYLNGLDQLRQAGLLEACVDPDTLSKLKTQLDWRSFVDSHYRLKGAPNNYYGVAFGMAELRYRLGWEDRIAADALRARMTAHYRTYSGFGFADELEGQGRFDRYSVLLIGEIAHRHVQAGRDLDPDMRRWLRASAELLLLRLNQEGQGFEYGRSIGAYGETAFLEVLSAAAWFGLLTLEEKDAAYSFSSVVAQRYMRFWVDAGTGSLNMWDKGRRTDGYRGKNRILGENLSLAQQIIQTGNLWARMGYNDRTPMTDLVAWRRRQPELTTTWFARNDYDRALITRRDGERLFSLPLINGGAGQHMNTPYFPIPFSPGLIDAAADTTFPQLIIRVTLKDGAVLQPLTYYRDVEVRQEGSSATVAYRQTQLDRMGQAGPQPDDRLSVDTFYRFDRGQVARTDRFFASHPVEVASIDLEFAGLSMLDRVVPTAGGWVVSYSNGAARTFKIKGLKTCTEAPLNETYRTPTGAFLSRVTCQSPAFTLTGGLTIGWELSYR